MVCKNTTNIVQVVANVNARQSYRKTSPDVLLYTRLFGRLSGEEKHCYQLSYFMDLHDSVRRGWEFFLPCANLTGYPSARKKTVGVSLKNKLIIGKRDIKKTSLCLLNRLPLQLVTNAHGFPLLKNINSRLFHTYALVVNMCSLITFTFPIKRRYFLYRAQIRM